MKQSQREAIVDLLLLGMYSDANLKISEDEAIQNSMAGLGWESGESLDLYQQRAIGKIRPLIENAQQGAERLLPDISARLEDVNTRLLALGALRQLVRTDEEEAAPESRLLAAAKTTFGV